MTVEELIAELQKHDPKAVVMRESDGHHYAPELLVGFAVQSWDGWWQQFGETTENMEALGTGDAIVKGVVIR